MAGPLDIVIRFTGDASDAISAANKTSDAYGGAAQKMSKVGLAMSAAVSLPLALAGKAAVSELENQAKVAAQTTAVLKSTGGAAGVSAKQVDELAKSLMAKSGADDEAIASSENVLLTFTKVHNEAGKGNDIFNRATTAALDLSTAFGKDLQSSAVLVGKALQDPIKGMAALARVGVQLSDAQKESVKSFVAQGDVMSAQKVILQELETEVGGSAAAFGKTLPGQIKIAEETLRNTGATMVAVVAPGLRLMAEMAKGVATAMAELPAPVQAAITVFAIFAAGLGPMLTIMGNMGKIVGAIGPAFRIAQTAVEGWIVVLGEMSFATIAATAGIALLVAAIALITYKIVTNKTETDKLKESASSLVEQWDASASASGSAATRLSELQGQLEANTNRMNYLKDATKGYGDITHLTTGELLQMTPAQQSLINGLANETQIRNDLLPKIKEAQAAVQAEAAEAAISAAKLDTLATAALGVAAAHDKERDSINGAANAYFASQGGIIGYQAAQLQAEAAQIKLNEATAKFPPESLEVRQATNAVEQANLAAAQAGYKMEDATGQLSQTLDQKAVPALIAARDTLILAEQKQHDASGATQIHIDRLNEMIRVAGTIPPETPMVVNAETEAATRALDALSAKADVATRTRQLNIEIMQGGFDPSGSSETGGIVPGHYGSPQMMLLHAGERVVPRNKASSHNFGGNGSSGGGTVINVNVQVPANANPADVGSKVVDSIRAYERVAGVAWRT
jgi:hypothetical protein